MWEKDVEATTAAGGGGGGGLAPPLVSSSLFPCGVVGSSVVVSFFFFSTSSSGTLPWAVDVGGGGGVRGETVVREKGRGTAIASASLLGRTSGVESGTAVEESGGGREQAAGSLDGVDVPHARTIDAVFFPPSPFASFSVVRRDGEDLGRTDDRTASVEEGRGTTMEGCETSGVAGGGGAVVVAEAGEDATISCGLERSHSKNEVDDRRGARGGACHEGEGEVPSEDVDIDVDEDDEHRKDETATDTRGGVSPNAAELAWSASAVAGGGMRFLVAGLPVAIAVVGVPTPPTGLRGSGEEEKEDAGAKRGFDNHTPDDEESAPGAEEDTAEVLPRGGGGSSIHRSSCGGNGRGRREGGGASASWEGGLSRFVVPHRAVWVGFLKKGEATRRECRTRGGRLEFAVEGSGKTEEVFREQGEEAEVRTTVTPPPPRGGGGGGRGRRGEATVEEDGTRAMGTACGRESDTGGGGEERYRL